VHEVSTLIGEIDEASGQQASGLDQINVSVTQLDRNTQQNATMVKQATAAAEAMREQTRGLLSSVSVFRVAGQAEREGADQKSKRGAALLRDGYAQNVSAKQ
jgi:methyl-accepting chemotaxis protein